MNNYKIKVNDEAESKEAQELFFELGYSWFGCGKHYSGIGNFNYITAYPDEMRLRMGWGGDTQEEITLPQLRDLVAQTKSKVREYLDPYDNYKLCLINPSDAAHWMIEVPEKAEFLLKWQANHPTFYRNKYGERYNRSYKQWDLVEGDEGIKEMICLWSREPIQPEQGLISGAEPLSKVEAFEAWINGFDVEAIYENEATLIDADTPLYIFHTSHGFRLKPRTIKLELEIPAPFEPKVGEIFYYISDEHETGYAHSTLWCEHAVDIWIGMWRNEEEIKQVVAALRGIKQ